jgi:hypothetical protein
VLALAFSALLFAFGRPVYALPGGVGGELDAALAYERLATFYPPHASRRQTIHAPRARQAGKLPKAGRFQSREWANSGR